MHDFIKFFDENIAWGWHLIILITICSVLCTVKSGFVQRHLLLGFRAIKDSGGFSSLCLSLSATIGTGNIIGVAMAVSIGGPGALFWMLVAAFLGMATKYAEGVLGVKYMTDGKSGAFYYIERGLGKKFSFLAMLFAFFGMVAGLLGIGTVTQISGIAISLNEIFSLCKIPANTLYVNLFCGIVFSAVTALIIFGGGKRIVKVSTTLVPIMATLFMILSFAIIIINYKELPNAAASIIKGAFMPESVIGGISGAGFKTAVQQGISRGVLSNEAGLGTASISVGVSKDKDAVSGGLVQMMSAFIDTAVICTVSGLCVILSGSYKKGLFGVNISADSFSCIPLPGNISKICLYLCIILFAFSTIIGWNYYGEECCEYLFKDGAKIYKIFYCIAVFLGPLIKADTVWMLADICNAFMAFPNIIAVCLLLDKVKYETNKFFNNR